MIMIGVNSWESEKKPGHSAGKDYSVRYGSRKMHCSCDHNEGRFPGGVDKQQGLIERRPL